jgi:hypothetical protein
MLSSNPTQGPSNNPATSRTKLAALLSVALAAAGCQADTTGNTDPDSKDETAHVTPEESAEPKTPHEERCDEYRYKACLEKLTRDEQSMNSHCFARKVPEGLNLPVVQEHVYRALLTEDGKGFDQELCNPYKLNADPDLHHLMKARFLSLNPEMRVKYDVSDNGFLTKRIAAFDQQGDQAFEEEAELLADFREVLQKCTAWDADPEHKLLPGACLLALDNKDKRVTTSPPAPRYPSW